jgi:diaminohydroxyphosphoribosylaminopyrimidine deaminase/5-amino-6-(5-phosphoribosylamino)uracil reductase
MRDPDPRVSGKGFDELRASGVRVEVGLCESDARRLNEAFIAIMTLGRPLVVLKAATSLDARVAARAGARTAITSREANHKSQLLRATIDAIAVGSETVLVDDPLLTARGCYRERPLVRVVFDRRLRTPVTSRLLSTLSEGPLLIVTNELTPTGARRAAPLTAAGAHIIEAPTIVRALGRLPEWNISTLLVEGGPTLQRGFVEAGVVDRLHLVIAPHVLGDEGVKWLDVQTWELPHRPGLTVEPRGSDIWIEADVHGDR